MTAAAVKEVFLLQLEKHELELIQHHAECIFAVEYARELTPDAMVLTGDGNTKPLADFLAELGAKSMGRAATKFLSHGGAAAAKQLANKLRQLNRLDLL